MTEEPKGEETPPDQQVIEAGDTEPIEGGYVAPFEELAFDEGQHRAETARKMAFLLVWIMAISVGIHFLTTAALAAAANKEAVESLATIFSMWLPVISGLVSSAATYYFTKENQK
jgi:hypothetical protein